MALGGGALGAGALGAVVVNQVSTPATFRRERFTVEVGCLSNLFHFTAPGNQQGSADSRNAFLVEGWIYPEGTIPGDGFIPTEKNSIGRWFCRGWIIIDADRDQPHGVTDQTFVFGSITTDHLFPPDTLMVSGLEGTNFRDTPATRAVVGGTGRYLGATGEVQQTYFSDNTTKFPAGGAGPNFREVFDIRVLE
jgi:hypothetical protein